VAFRRKNGFTLIELMIALVVGGMLMAGLVGMAGSMQRSFGQSKDITELQANLRFALFRMTDDLHRTAFMYLAQPGDATDPSKSCHLLGDLPPGAWSPTGSWDAIEYDTTNFIFTLRGNFSSSRDYLLEFTAGNQGEIVCRNGMKYPCTIGGLTTSEDYDEPFADGQPFSKIFVINQVFRMEAQPGVYTYHRVTGLPGGLSITYDPPAKMGTQAQGPTKWISPITTIQYQVLEKPAGSGNWTLVRRRFYGNTPQPDVEIAELLLPPTANPNTSGFFVEIYNDNSVNAKFCAKPWQPVISAPSLLAATPNVLRARALRITIRGRSRDEDPNFVLTNYTTDSKAKNYGIDLDGTPQNGLAYVRVQRTVVQLQNLGLNISM
jgi:prepilin-type N-terminal cleavage/methylation domain-containing protein